MELTRYGTGGSYGALDGTVIANIEHRTKEEVMSTIVHEIIHIGIEHLIQEYLDDKNNQKHHWYKERLVDLIGEMYFPGLRKTQNLNKIIIKNVDEVFNTFFPDMETIVQSLKNMI